MASNTIESVKEYYGKCLKKTEDLKTGACTAQKGKFPSYILEIQDLIHDEVKTRYYGCGPVFPPGLQGASVLDLGCGSGQDCYILSKLVGSEGQVVGLDMTDEQLSVANKFIEYHTQLYQYANPNVRFVKGYMEKMEDVGIESDSFDVVVSNCVINLCKDKAAVLKEALRVLKVGGELYFSDIYGDQHLPENIKENEELWCEGFTGALHWKDLHNLAKEIGFSSPRLVTAGSFPVLDQQFKELLGEARFVSATYRLFKIPQVQNEAVTVVYNGGVQGHNEELLFDHSNTFKEGEECQVDTQLAAILKSSRYRQYFTFISGDGGTCKCEKLEKDPFEFCKEQEKRKCCS